MKRLGGKYRRKGILGLPVLLLIAFWIGLWFLWPVAVPRQTMRTPSKGRIAYVGNVPRNADVCREALLFVYAPPRHLRVPVGEAVDGDGVSRAVEVQFLERRSRAPGSVTMPAALCETPAMRTSVYRPPWNEGGVFAAMPSGDMSVLVDMSDTLREKGFQMPDIPVESLKSYEKPWQATLFVRCDAAGRADNVFLESRCDDAGVNAMLVRTARGARLAQSGLACEGRVTVSYGRN